MMDSWKHPSKSSSISGGGCNVAAISMNEIKIRCLIVALISAAAPWNLGYATNQG